MDRSNGRGQGGHNSSKRAKAKQGMDGMNTGNIRIPKHRETTMLEYERPEVGPVD